MELNLSKQEPLCSGTGQNLKMYCLTMVLVCSTDPTLPGWILLVSLTRCSSLSVYVCWWPLTVCLKGPFWAPGALVPSLDIKHHLSWTQVWYASKFVFLSWVHKFWLMNYSDHVYHLLVFSPNLNQITTLSVKKLLPFHHVFSFYFKVSWNSSISPHGTTTSSFCL
jgi:hypothetical protein